jgi:hypothetical protein
MAQTEIALVPQVKSKRGRPQSPASAVLDETLEASALLRQAAGRHIQATQTAAKAHGLIRQALVLLEELGQHQTQATRYTAEAFKAQRRANGLAESLPKAG